MNRKDDHIRLALTQSPTANDFDFLRFQPVTFPEISMDEVNLSITLFHQSFPTPLYINAMTGGSANAKILNERFAMLAKHFGLLMATGSVSAALKDPTLHDTFTVIRQVNPTGFVMANLGAGQTLDHAKKAIALLQANALQIHVNAVQEAIMPEGDKDYRGWLSSLKTIREGITIPLIVKEVGFGMAKPTLSQLKHIGIEYVDLAGKGGTNFAEIENARRTDMFASLSGWGLSTVESLLEAKNVTGLHYLASGGIRNPMDVIKALALGAKAVGLSGYFLHLVTNHDHDQCVKIFAQFLLEMKTIMLVLGAKNISDLTMKTMIFSDKFAHYRKDER